MQNQQHTPQATVVLKDGLTPLATWSHDFDQRPTIGEILTLPAAVQARLEGYSPEAAVTRIELRTSPKPDRIELEADCRTPKEKRPVVVLNSDRIRDSLHESAEAHLRKTLRFPLVSWEHSPHPDPVVRFHDPVTNHKTCPPEVRAGLIELLYPEMEIGAPV
ncbi:hypothetical protein JIN84_22610 [Luteolibacter yonseiensis]|uniref:Uncharacterized protein n=1 Tax=Luteolibacter yonseiensis TaxID=1144680 RepID=A0A934R9K7_9BACT|nr:hypothetical protein [Luteolibacter yonseiensis]MBK1818428.1 hypothetical protein [Luteolibacter yonseiensis]